MNSINTKISKHAKDIIQKYTSGLFRNATLEFYGIKTAKVKELINVELPKMEVSNSSSDIIFLLEDNTYLHFEFQSTYNKEDLIRFAGYDLRLFERDKRCINTIVIYTADVKETPTSLNIGSMIYNPNYIMMKDYNGNDIYTGIEAKIKAKQELTDIDMLNLIFLPLMRNTISRKDLAVTSIKLAQTIVDATKRNACIAAVFAFASRYLNNNEIGKLMEVLRMTDLAVMFVEEGIQEGMQKRAIEIAKNALREGIGFDVIKKITGLDESTIKRIQAELDND